MKHLFQFKEEIEFLFAFPTIGPNDPYIFAADHLASFGDHIRDSSTEASLTPNEFINGIKSLDGDGLIRVSPGKLRPNGFGMGAFFAPSPKGDENQGDSNSEEGRCHSRTP